MMLLVGAYLLGVAAMLLVIAAMSMWFAMPGDHGNLIFKSSLLAALAGGIGMAITWPAVVIGALLHMANGQDLGTYVPSWLRPFVD